MQTTHTILAQSRWDGLCCAAQSIFQFFNFLNFFNFFSIFKFFNFLQNFQLFSTCDKSSTVTCPFFCRLLKVIFTFSHFSIQYYTRVLRLTRVRAQPQSQHLRQASASCSTALLMLLFLAQVCKHRHAISALFNCPCRIDHVVVGWSCWKLPHRATDRIRFPAWTRASLLSACGPDTRGRTSTRASYLWLRAVYL